MFARGSVGILIIPPLAGLFLLYLGLWVLAMAFFGLSIIVLVFFRDPERDVGKGIVSAADGIVDYVKQNDDWLLISVFMNLHNVHVNRAPLGGKAVHVSKRHGGRWPAFMEKSKRNAKAIMVFETDYGQMRVEQIAGIFAWRVCPYVRRWEVVRRGQRIGMIRFGSRVNVWLPVDRVVCRVKPGDRTVAGVTTIAEVK